MAKMVLIRGVPGSGKSTAALSAKAELESVGEKVKHFEADMFFTDEDGNYSFDTSKIRDAHQWCQNETRKALSEGYNVIVSNTFTRVWEIQPYLDMIPRGDILVVRLLSRFKNIHKVPDEIVDKMADRMENVDGEILVH